MKFHGSSYGVPIALEPLESVESVDNASHYPLEIGNGLIKSGFQPSCTSKAVCNSWKMHKEKKSHSTLEPCFVVKPTPTLAEGLPVAYRSKVTLH
jgi:hypothetical protein